MASPDVFKELADSKFLEPELKAAYDKLASKYPKEDPELLLCHFLIHKHGIALAVGSPKKKQNKEDDDGKEVKFKVHGMSLSANSLSAAIFAKDAGVGDLHVCDLMKGANRTPEFLAMNPFHQLPTLEGHQMAIGESNAMLRFLAANFAQKYYPDDAKLRGRIDWAMDAMATSVYTKWSAVFYPVLGFASPPADLAKANAEMKESIDCFAATFISDDNFICGSTLTIADYKVLPFFFVLTLDAVEKQTGIKLSSRLQKYVKAVMAATPASGLLTSFNGFSLKEYVTSLPAKPAYTGDVVVVGDVPNCAPPKTGSACAKETKAKIHGLTVSSNCMAPILFAADAGVGAFEMCNVMAGAHKTPDFLAKKQFHQVPTYEGSDGFCLGESSAMLRYMATNYAPSFYPEDQKLRASIDWALDAIGTSIYKKAAVGIFYPVMGFGEPPADQKVENDGCLEMLGAYEKAFLVGSKFVGGEQLTIAEYKVLPILFAINEPLVTKNTGFALPPRFVKYLSDIMSAVKSSAMLESAGGYSIKEFIASKDAPSANGEQVFVAGTHVHAQMKRPDGTITNDFYPGIIAKVNEDGTVFVKFDDGDIWEDAPVKCLRPFVEQRLVVGSVVRASYIGGFFSAVVESINDNGSFHIKYDDGREWGEVPRKHIKTPLPDDDASKEKSELEKPLNVGSRVKVTPKSSKQVRHGRITEVKSEGVFKVKFDDGEERLLNEKEQIKAVVERTVALGSRVQAYHKRKDDSICFILHHGTVMAVNGDGTFHIEYDEGHVWKSTPKDFVIAMPPERPVVVGAKVEARTITTRFFPGRIAALNDNGNFRIKYDDGDCCSDLPKEFVIAVLLVEEDKAIDSLPKVAPGIYSGAGPAVSSRDKHPCSVKIELKADGKFTYDFKPDPGSDLCKAKSLSGSYEVERTVHDKKSGNDEEDFFSYSEDEDEGAATKSAADDKRHVAHVVLTDSAGSQVRLGVTAQGVVEANVGISPSSSWLVLGRS